jgi:nucleotide-binding universal stress UspA family protein
MFNTVLFPFDRSLESREAAEVVSDFVQQHHSRLVILSVVQNEPSTTEPSTTEPNRSPSTIMSSPTVVAKLLQEAQSLFIRHGIQAETIERSGKPAFTICDVADEVAADLIIMGTRGLLSSEGTHDSVTNRVISLSPCPVLVVP